MSQFKTQPSKSKPCSTIKVAIIGYGYSAKTFHLPLIKANDAFDLIAIVSSRPDSVSLDLPGVAVYPKVTQLVEARKDIDLVVITVPSEHHFSVAKQCLQSSLNVVIEKPMVTCSSEALTLIELAEANRLVLSVFHNRRWDGDFLTIKKLLRDNQVGQPKIFESNFDRFRPNVRKRWREQAGKGSGIWFDLGSHLVDQALLLFGMPESVTARCLLTRLSSETVDYFQVQLHYPEHEVVLRASSFSAGPNRRFHLQGQTGSYLKYGLDPQELQLKQGLEPTHEKYGIEAEQTFGKLYRDQTVESIATLKGDYPCFYAELAACLKTGSPCPVTATEILPVLKILEIAEESSLRGVRLPVAD
jgi:predicted dehydrogenase